MCGDVCVGADDPVRQLRSRTGGGEQMHNLGRELAARGGCYR